MALVERGAGATRTATEAATAPSLWRQYGTAGFFMAPVLTVISDTVGILGGWLIAVYQLRVASSLYWTSITEALYLQDAWMGIIKPFFLGFAIVTIGCHVGLRTTGGTQGVGRSTTNAVVAAQVAVLAVNFFVTKLLIVLLYR